GALLGVAQPPEGGRREDLVDLEPVRLSEADHELGRRVRQPYHAVAVGEVHGKERAVAHLVVAHGESIATADEQFLGPRRLPGLDEPFHPHAQVHEPAAIAEPRRPRDAYEGGGRAQPERPALLDEDDERRAPRLGLASPAAAALGDGLGEEPEAPLADHATPDLP